MRHSTPRWIAAVTAALLIVPPAVAAAQDAGEEIERLEQAMAVLRDLARPSDESIPPDILAGAEAVIVIPDMIRGGFIVGGKHGRGVVSVRDRATRSWSPPAFVAMTGGSVGWQIGAESVDLVLLVMNRNGVERLLDNQFTLGGSLSATAGPVGRSAGASTDVSLGSQILAYSRTRGLFAGATLEGVSLRADDDANEDFYGRELDLEQIMVRRAPNSRAPLVVTQWADLMRSIAAFGDERRADRDSPAWPQDDRQAAGARRSAPERVNLAALVEDLDAFEGRYVTITAPVEDIFSRTLFSVDDDPARATRRDVIVINPQPVDRLDAVGTVVVTGVVYEFDRDDLERRLGAWRWDVGDDLLDSFDDRPVIIADSVRSTGREFVGTAAPRREAGVRIDDRPLPPAPLPPGGAFGGTLVTVDELLDDARDFYGRQVMITAEIEDVYSRTAFAIDDDRLLSTGRDVLILAPGLRGPVRDDLDVTIVGEVMEFDRGDIEDRLPGYRLDLRDDLVRAFDNRPVIIATSIRTRDGQELIGR